MTLDYRKRLVDYAQSCADGGSGRDELFDTAYDNWLQKKRPGLKSNDDLRFIVRAARMVGIPLAVLPNLVNGELRGPAGLPDAETFTPGASIPMPGDLVVHDGNRVGLVVVAESDTRKIAFAEASTNGSGRYGVWIRSLFADSAFIDCYYSPDYALRRIRRAVNQTQLSSLVKRSWTRCFQEWLNDAYEDAEVPTDGVLNTRVKTEFVNAWKAQLNRDARVNLAMDGTFDAEARLAATKRCLKLRSTGNMVKLLQGLLYAHGYDPKAFDGKFSASTRDAVTAFQKNRHLLVTSTVDPSTWESLLTRW